jgi:hypothetical protein
MLAGLRACPTHVVFLAILGQQAVGLAVCSFGFSTFNAKPLLNIHDLVVHSAYRRLGVATELPAHIWTKHKDPPTLRPPLLDHAAANWAKAAWHADCY